MLNGWSFNEAGGADVTQVVPFHDDQSVPL